MMAAPLPADWVSPPNPNPRRSTAAFTLIELLVVVSIIAVLISILLPALARARESARTLQCATQLRQVQMGLLNYAYESDGALPWSHSGSSPFPPPYQVWGGLLAKGGHVPLVELFWCPSHDMSWAPNASGVPLTSVIRNMRNTTTGSSWAYTGYSANRYGAMPPQRDISLRPINVDTPGIPGSDLFILAEAYSPAQHNQTPTRGGWYILDSASKIFTHQGDANISFLDGHVETRKSEALGYSYADHAWIPGYDRKPSPWYHQVYTKPPK